MKDSYIMNDTYYQGPQYNHEEYNPLQFVSTAQQCVNRIKPSQLNDAVETVLCDNNPVELIKKWILLASTIEERLDRIANNTSHLFFLFAGVLLIIIILQIIFKEIIEIIM